MVVRSEKEKGEGVILRNNTQIYKIKKEETIDAVITGYTTEEKANEIRSVSFGIFINQNEIMHIGSSGNFSDLNLKKSLFNELTSLKINSNFQKVASNGAAYTFVKPKIVLELKLLEFQADKSNDDPVKHVIGVVHAGRVGTQKAIFTNTIEVLSHEYGSSPKDLIVGMGPAIGGCCYEVDQHCALPFIKRNSVNLGFVKKAGQKKYFLDLREVNRLEGCEAGILEENIYADGPCTSCDNHRWYSYRKEGKTGRLMTLAMLQLRK